MTYRQLYKATQARSDNIGDWDLGDPKQEEDERRNREYRTTLKECQNDSCQEMISWEGGGNFSSKAPEAECDHTGSEDVEGDVDAE